MLTLSVLQILTVMGDITEANIATSLIDGAINKFGRIDRLVNAAGILIHGTTFGHFSSKPGQSITLVQHFRAKSFTPIITEGVKKYKGQEITYVSGLIFTAAPPTHF